MTFDYDIIILGGGSAGIVSGVVAGAVGLRVLLIEKERMGGECLNTGCVPSKALLHAARVARTIRTASQVGFAPFEVSRSEAGGVLQRVRDTIRAVEAADSTEQMLRDGGVEIRFGAARFLDPHTLQLDGSRISAAHFILATGSSPAVPDVPGLAAAGYVTNRNVFDLEEIPETLLVVGGGPVGVEMAQAFARLGSRVTLVQQADRLLPRDDAELSEALEACLRDEGIDIRLGASLVAVALEDGRRIATLSIDGAQDEVICDQILLGAGRRPNVDGLCLEAAGVACDAKGVLVDAGLRTSQRHIYACGDLLGHGQFSHVAEYEAKIVVRNVVFPGRSGARFRLNPWCTFTDPELAHLGLTEEEAKQQGIRYEVYRQPFAQNDRAITDNEAKGLVKVLAQGFSGKLLGVHILGPRAGELVQEWILAMEHGHSLRDVADLIHIYPTLSMACQHAAQRWYERKVKEPAVAAALDAYVHKVRPRQRSITIGVAGAAIGAGIGFLWLASRRRGDP